MIRRPPRSPLFPYPTLFRSKSVRAKLAWILAISLGIAPPAWFLATLPPLDDGHSAVRAVGPALGDARRQVDLAVAYVGGRSTTANPRRHEHPARPEKRRNARAGDAREAWKDAAAGRAHAGHGATRV